MRNALFVLMLVGTLASLFAATPPDLLNYQGVLRDVSDNPLNGDHDMVFRFWSADVGGDEILVDEHNAANGNPVTVNAGMFNVELGGGIVTDGSGSGVYTSLADLFRDYGTVHLGIEIGEEILSPRVRVVASAYALNAGHLDGNDASAFAAAIHGHTGGDITGPVSDATNADTVDGKHASEFIDTTAGPQTKSGPLTADAGAVAVSTAVTGYGNHKGGYFADSDGTSSVSLAFGATGIESRGTVTAGYFQNTTSGDYSYLAWTGYGIQAFGNTAGGSFRDRDSSAYAFVALGDTGLEAYGDLRGGYFVDSDQTGSAVVAFGDRGIEALGNDAGGYFWDRDSSGYAYLGFGDRGIEALGNDMGGYFGDIDNSGYAEIGSGNWGVRAYGSSGGGYFEAVGGSGLANVGFGNRGIEAFGNVLGGKFQDLDSSGLAYAAYGDRGIEAYGNDMGGYFGDADETGYAYVGISNDGIRGYGNYSGGYFKDLNHSGYSYVGFGDYGIRAYGNAMGGSFEDRDHTGLAYVGVGDIGVKGYGNGAGGYFEDLNQSGYAYLARNDRGIEAYGDWVAAYFESLQTSNRAWLANTTFGVEGRGDFAGGQFVDSDESGFARIGQGDRKVMGNGGVSFVQNHPEDDGRVVVYTAPEGDEAATYTRGTARLIDGEARVGLGETFRWVTNPDIGLTAYVTPIGDWSDLYVAEKSTTELVIRSRVGAPDVAFDYIVYGLRIGFEETSVVQEKTIESFIPSMKGHRERYAKLPELRRYNAFERFKRMHAEVTGTDAESLDLSASAELRDAIHEYDQATDLPVHELLGLGWPTGGSTPASPAGDEPPPDPTSQPDAGSFEEAEPPAGSAGLLIGEHPDIRPDPDASEAPLVTDNVFPVSEPVEPGDLLVLDPDRPGSLRRADLASDPAVIGIVAGEPFEHDGSLVAPLHDAQFAHVKVDASYGVILAGDLLTTSPTPGHAMVATAPVPGTVVGKALESLDTGTGLIRVLVMAR